MFSKELSVEKKVTRDAIAPHLEGGKRQKILSRTLKKEEG